MKILSDDEIELSTGKVIYAHSLIIGLDIRLGDRSVTYGYDGVIDWPIPDWWTDEEKKDRSYYLTDREMGEVAEFMMERWSQIRDRCLKAEE